MVLLSQMMYMARRSFTHVVLPQTLGSSWDFTVCAGVDGQGNPIDSTVSLVDIPDGNGGTMKALSVVASA